MKDTFPESLGQKHGCALYMGVHYTRQNTMPLVRENVVRNNLSSSKSRYSNPDASYSKVQELHLPDLTSESLLSMIIMKKNKC